jgi:alpha-tubulin suppressor-like RCC1 family protein
MGTSTGAERVVRRVVPAPILVLLALAACEEGPLTPGGDAVSSVVLNPPTLTMAVGEQIRLDVIPRNGEGRAIPGSVSRWSSSAPAVAEVDAAGLIQARSEGVASISATVDGIVGTSTINVGSVAVSEWREHSCFVSDVGAVWCWGRGGNGELGIGERMSSPAPVKALLPEPAASVSVGAGHTCAVTAAGTAYCWGRGVEGQLGNASTVTRATPVPVSGGDAYRMVSAGGRHSCGITSAGDARCWGAAERGQLGNGALTNVATAVQPLGGLRFARISAGARHTCAVTTEGRAFCWGDNRAGQLGDGTLDQRPVPTAVLTDLRFTDISAGGRHSCAIATDRRPWCWGENTQGQLGNGSVASSAVPQEVRSFPGFVLTRLQAGGTHTCGVDPGGGAYCWGAGQFGQLGNGRQLLVGNPVQAAGFAFTDVLAGTGHSCGITTSSAALCWGLNVFGQLGTGDFADRSVPTPVAGSLIFRRGAP